MLDPAGPHRAPLPVPSEAGDRAAMGPRLRPRNPADRWLAVTAHAAGLLGLTVVGWLGAAVLSFLLFVLAGQRRSLYLAVHSSQAVLYQLAVLAADAAWLTWLAAGFISLGGTVDILPEWRFFDDMGEPWLTVAQLVWGLSALLWPVFHLATLAGAALQAVRTAQGSPFWYPLVSGPSRRLAGGPQRSAAPPPAEPLPGTPAGAPSGGVEQEPPV
ncbi:MAG TPA: hypothetical protein VHS99_18145 [Chloroflexota bacterium]|nr:hypothetical protein [Chloroflexota bacterium]